MAKFVSIIDSANYPVYFKSMESGTDIQSQFLAEMALDFIGPQVSSTTLLLVHDGVAIYGNVSNTNIKVFIGVNAQNAHTDLEPMFKAIHDLYVRYICNPFNNPEKRVVESPQFETKVEAIVKSSS